MTPITEFQGEFRFLSNFWPVEVEYEGDNYPSVEHAYQAAKTNDGIARAMIQRAMTAGQAKRLGRDIPMRPDWEAIKVDVMTELSVQKYQNKTLRTKLLATAGRELIEGNTWGDTFWGVCKGKGENRLGNILMAIRNYYLLDNPNYFKEQ